MPQWYAIGQDAPRTQSPLAAFLPSTVLGERPRQKGHSHRQVRLTKAALTTAPAAAHLTPLSLPLSLSAVSFPDSLNGGGEGEASF